MKVLDAQDEEIKLEDMDEDEGIFVSVTLKEQMIDVPIRWASGSCSWIGAKVKEAADAAEEDAADVEDVSDNFDTDEE